MRKSTTDKELKTAIDNVLEVLDTYSHLSLAEKHYVVSAVALEYLGPLVVSHGKAEAKRESKSRP